MTKSDYEFLLKGRSACGGSATGKARIALNLKEGFEKINFGDILVVRKTNADWLPVLLKADALVGEVGGVASHLAIVARELNKPAIVAAEDATKIIKDGDMIFVDATNGNVYKVH